MHRAIVVALSMLAVVSLAGPAASAEDGDHPNTTCGIDAVASHAGVAATIECLSLTPEIHGEFEGLVTVTLQADRGAGWVDVAADTCTGGSTEGLMILPCGVTATVAEDVPVRGLIDLDAPKSWRPAVAQPVYSGGIPLEDPLAEDDCHVNESAETFDLTAPDAPWLDLCAVSMDAVIDDAQGLVESIDVNVHVFGLLGERLPDGRWVTTLMTADCTHDVTVEDDLDGSTAAHVRTRCDRSDEACDDGPITVILELLGGCSVRVHEAEEVSVLPAGSVDTSGGSTMVVTMDTGDLGPLAAADLDHGTTIEAVSAVTTAGVTSDATGTVVIDADFAHSTGRTFTLR